MCVVLKDYLPSVISGLLTFFGVVVGIVAATKNISKQNKVNIELQQRQIDFQQTQSIKALLREKAELLHERLLKIDELCFDAHSVSLSLEEDFAPAIRAYQSFRVELSREVLASISLIEIYFSELLGSEAYNQRDLVMRFGAIQNLIMQLRHYDDYKKGRLANPPANKDVFEADRSHRIKQSFNEMQDYLSKSNLVNLMKDLRQLIGAKYV